MQVSTRLASTVALGVLTAGLAWSPSDAWAQAGGNPGQFGGGAPGQFDPSSAPAGGTTTPAPEPLGGVNPGGTAPPSNQPAPASTPTFVQIDPNDPTQTLDDAKGEDSGRGLTWFWLEVGGGIEHVGLQTISAAEVDDSELCASSANCVVADRDTTARATTGTGPMIEAGLGARVLFFTVGARGRLGFFERYDLARIGGEVGFRVPLGSLEPRVDAGFGYAATMNGNAATGYYARLRGGLDYFLSTNFAVGGDISSDLFVLSAEPPTVIGSAQSDSVTIMSNAGGTGLGVALGLHAGLHL